MAGYNGYSMSNNAVEAYKGGEKPLSKWTKTEIIDAVEKAIAKGELVLTCDFARLKKLPAKALRTHCLSRTSWHHTSNRYNKTDFYSISFGRIENLTDEAINNIIENNKVGKQEEEKQEQVQDKWRVAFLEWSGSRKHPKATEIIEVGVVKDGWFYRSDGTKKNTTAKGFRFIEKIK